MEQWYYRRARRELPKVKITALQFRNKKRQPINYETGSAWAIPKGSKNPTAACTWIEGDDLDVDVACSREEPCVDPQVKNAYTASRRTLCRSGDLQAA